MRRVCSSVESINQDNVKQFEYFQVLLKACLKVHKDKMKSFGSELMEVDMHGPGSDGKLKIAHFI